MRPLARFLVQSGGEGILLLRPGRFVIGRHSDCDLIIDSHEVSRRHAVLDVGASSVRLVDLRSRNGTRVDGEPTTRCLLGQGCLVEIGPATCLFEWMEGVAFSDDHPTPAAKPQELEQCLTPAEQRVFTRLLGGLSEKQIALKLELSCHTVHNHIKKIYRAYRVNSSRELLARFIATPGEKPQDGHG